MSDDRPRGKRAPPRAYSRPLESRPGEKWQYSNLGYFILAEVIRRVSGRPWSEFPHDRVFEPLGMDATRPTAIRDSVPGLAVGYRDNDRLLEADDWPAVRPSGAFLSTVLDLAKWDGALYADDVLADSTRETMVDESVAVQLVQLGFLSELARYVDDGLTVVVLMNLDDADVEAIANGVAALYLEVREPSERLGGSLYGFTLDSLLEVRAPAGGDCSTPRP